MGLVFSWEIEVLPDLTSLRLDLGPRLMMPRRYQAKGLRICGRSIGKFGAVAGLRGERMEVFFFLRRLAGEG